MNSVLKALYYGDLAPADHVRPREREYAERNNKLFSKIDQLQARLSETDRAELDSLLDLLATSQDSESLENFCSGAAFGVFLMQELFSIRKQLLQP